jgi:hypothetical protein
MMLEILVSHLEKVCGLEKAAATPPETDPSKAEKSPDREAEQP